MLSLERSASLKNSATDMVKEKTIIIPSDIKRVKEVSSRILDALKPYRVDDSTIFDIRLCVEEAVINAIMHGNKKDAEKKVTVVYWVEDGKLHVEVADEGKGFDCGHLTDPTLQNNIMRDCGRGVFLIKHLAEKIKYNETGNKITIVKNLKGKEGPKKER